jgi:hypothetical protein
MHTVSCAVSWRGCTSWRAAKLVALLCARLCGLQYRLTWQLGAAVFGLLFHPMPLPAVTDGGACLGLR